MTRPTGHTSGIGNSDSKTGGNPSMREHANDPRKEKPKIRLSGYPLTSGFHTSSTCGLIEAALPITQLLLCSRCRTICTTTSPTTISPTPVITGMKFPPATPAPLSTTPQEINPLQAIETGR